MAFGLSRLKRGDLGQLAPRKKLLKSFTSFPEDFLRPSEHSLAGGIFALSLRAALSRIPFKPMLQPRSEAGALFCVARIAERVSGKGAVRHV